MKKTIACICILFGVLGVRADVRTNYVYVVSNIFNNVYTESIVTQKVKSSHTDFYYTNYVSVVTNVYQTTFRTNVSVNVDVSQTYVNAAANAASNALSFASQSAASASAAGSSASSASSAASRAAASAASASSAASDGLQRINERINWFDLHSGETITMLTSNVTINVNAQDYSYTYTNAAGQAFDYVTVHPYGANGGATVAARSSGAYNTVKIRAWPRPRESSKWWDFSPAYVDYDDKGMRLQYLPDTTVPIKYVGGAGVYPNGKIVPEYFYWQSGYIYFKVRVWENGEVVAWCLTRYQWNNWPNTIGYGGDNGTAMALVDREGYGTSDMGTTLAYFYSKTRTDSANAPIEFPMSPSPSYNPTIEWMRDGPKVSVLEDRVAELAAQWTTVQGQWSAIQADWTTAQATIADFATRLQNAENGYPHAYTSPGGVTYPNIIYYDRATDDGKVAVTTVGDYYPSTEYQFVPNYGGNATANYWIFRPAYVDTDLNGLRIHYLPTQAKTVTATSYNAGYLYVPRDFYWQNGVVYVVIDSYNGTTWSGRLRMKYEGTGANAWPNGILQNQNGTALSTTNFRSMIFDTREGTIMGTSTSSTVTFGFLRTNYHQVMSSYDSVLWIPGTYSVEQKPIVDWLATWVR